MGLSSSKKSTFDCMLETMWLVKTLILEKGKTLTKNRSGNTRYQVNKKKVRWHHGETRPSGLSSFYVRRRKNDQQTKRL